MKEIENMKTIVTSCYFDAITNVSSSLFCEFVPDEIVLKYVSIVDVSAQNNTHIYQLSSSLLDNQIFYTFATELNAAGNGTVMYNEQVNTPFFHKNKQNIQGNYSFTLSSYPGDTNLNAANTNVYFSLTFVMFKYKEKK